MSGPSIRRSIPVTGFALVELLIAAVVAGVVLSGAYGWLWNVGALARAQDDQAQAATIAGVAARTVAADVRASLAVVSPSPAHDAAHSLLLTHEHIATANEAVTIVWDPARRVLWRNASGTYIADHVVGFDVGYVLAGGGPPTQGAMLASADWHRVRAVCLAITVAVDTARVTRHVRVLVGL